jgi:hypothetical protein
MCMIFSFLYPLFSDLLMIVSSSFFFLFSLSGNTKSQCAQFSYCANFCSFGYLELVFIVKSVVVGFLYTSISNCPCLLIRFKSKYAI